MTPELGLSIASCLMAAASVVIATLRGNTRKEEARATAMDTLGKRYAALGWAYSKVQADSIDPAKARKHALEGFILADTSADGKRDFTDKQAAVYIDAHV